MTPNFALILSFQTIRLMDRGAGGWAELARADLAEGTFDAAMEHLRSEAEATGQALTCSALLPLEQVKFLTVPDALDETGVRRAMTGATPYRLSELVIDWMQEGGQTYIAACARETLQEAETVLTGAGFVPISLGAIPPKGRFPREVWFGPCGGADVAPPTGAFAEVPRAEAVFGSRSGAVAQGVSAPRRLSLGPAEGLAQARASGLVDPAPDSAGSTGLERAARAGMIEDVPSADAAPRTAEPRPLRAERPAPHSRATTPSAKSPPSQQEAERATTKQALAPGAAGGDGLPDTPQDTGPVATEIEAPAPSDALPQDAAASLTALRATQFDTPQAHAEALHRRSSWPLGLAAVLVAAVVGGLWWTSRGGELPGLGSDIDDTPVDVAVETDVPTPLGTVLAPTRPAVQPSPLTAPDQGMLASGPAAGAAPTVEASAPERLGSVVASDAQDAADATPEPVGADALAGAGALGEVLSPDEARRIYAATGVWLRAPQTGAPPLGPTEFARPAAAAQPDRVVMAQAPSAQGLRVRAVTPPQPVLPRDQVFVLDARGVVPATAQGAQTPFGALAYLGAPPGSPKFRPLPVGPMDDIPEGFSPRPRPVQASGTAIDAALQEANEGESAEPDADDQSALPQPASPLRVAQQSAPDGAAQIAPERSLPVASSQPVPLTTLAVAQTDAAEPRVSDSDPAQIAVNEISPLPATPASPSLVTTVAASAAQTEAAEPTPQTAEAPVALSGLTPPPVAPRRAAPVATPEAPVAAVPTRPEVTRAPVTGGVALTAVGGATPAESAPSSPERPGVSAASTAAAGAVGLALLTTPLPPERPDALTPAPGAASVVPHRRPAGLDVTPARPSVAVASAQVARPSGPVNRTVAARATQENVLNLRKYNLISVSGKSGSRAALVRSPNGRVSRVKVGDRLDGGQVRAINQGSLHYLKRGRTITLRMPRG